MIIQEPAKEATNGDAAPAPEAETKEAEATNGEAKEAVEEVPAANGDAAPEAEVIFLFVIQTKFLTLARHNFSWANTRLPYRRFVLVKCIFI